MMEEETTGVGSRFGLRRDNFILDPVEDFECFARPDINTRTIAESLEIDVITGLAPKRLLWGPYGGGKTHTLMRTVTELSQLASIHTVRIECPDLTKRSRFHDLYREGIMRGLGQDFVLGLMQEVTEKVGFKRPEELRQSLKEWFRDEEVSKAAERLYDPNFDRLRLWRWLSGVSLSRGDLDQLGQTQDLTETEAARLSEIIVMFGRLLRALRKKTLVLILDEMERLRAIGAETVITFMSGFTRLVDQNQTSVCVLIGSSAVTQAEMVDVFTGSSPVTSRLGTDAYMEIPPLPDPDVDAFVQGVISYVRKSDLNVSALLKNEDAQGETLSEQFYPFTSEAVEAIKSGTRTLTPRDITIQMTRALGRAHRKSITVITSECVR
jgi:hypothetical protein